MNSVFDLRVLSSSEQWLGAELISEHMFCGAVSPQSNIEQRCNGRLTTGDVSDWQEHLEGLGVLQFGAFDQEGNLISVAGLARHRVLSPGETGRIVDVVTRCDFRRYGLARMVLANLESYASDFGLTELCITDATPAGGYLYQSTGYEWDNYLPGYSKKL